MHQEAERVRIPYDEYRAINDLARAHLHTHEGKLRAIIAFGELVTNGETYDIDLLEVVEGWAGQKSAVFSSSSALPLRGQLRLYLLTPGEFERTAEIKRFADKSRIENILDRVREGYDVIYEDPPGYAVRVLAQENSPRIDGNPLEFLVNGSGTRTI